MGLQGVTAETIQLSCLEMLSPVETLGGLCVGGCPSRLSYTGQCSVEITLYTEHVELSRALKEYVVQFI